ncbi:MAG: signal peptidase I [Clostridium sp.]|uniref:signal peptidase I n=1 Tax=Clostridium sp. TaxID=1506 RepID=UPI003059C67A
MIKFLKEWAAPVIIALVLALLINKFIFFNVDVPTKSMYPTIKPGDKIFSLRKYKQSSIERGDILIFKSEELGKDLIKRVVGLPGESVEIQADGSVYIDGKYLEEKYVSSKSDIKGSFNIPEDCYLFLGDNRDDSVDARMWKNPYISFDDIMGEAEITIFPFSRFGKLE